MKCGVQRWEKERRGRRREKKREGWDGCYKLTFSMFYYSGIPSPSTASARFNCHWKVFRRLSKFASQMMTTYPQLRIASPLKLCVLHESASVVPSDTSAILTRNHLASVAPNTRMRRRWTLGWGTPEYHVTTSIICDTSFVCSFFFFFFC